jgi:deoxyribonuclease-4
VDILIGHLGFYGPDGPTVSLDRVTKEIKSIRDWLDKLPGGHRILLGIEPNGHPEVMGSRQEILQIAKRVNRVIPILNIPHLAVRESSSFEDKKELEAIMEEFTTASHGELYINFSGVMVQGRGSFRMNPIKRGKVKFENVAEALTERGFDATVISSSPLMEHDAMYMKLLHERALAKQFARKAAEKRAPLKAAAAAKPAPKSQKKPAPKPRKGKGKPAPKPAPKKKVRPQKKPVRAGGKRPPVKKVARKK